ncbi:hypothetical protein ART_1701 [Arthrobacter sp. PAMC 25486]|nr:hypothetical protein ART_1701 [Arthrobacter sp. PAMC 25486]
MSSVFMVQAWRCHGLHGGAQRRLWVAGGPALPVEEPPQPQL